MQIQGDYSYSNNAYEQKHTHHITKCLHEEGHERQQAATAGMKSDTLSMQKAGQEAVFEPSGLYETAKKITDQGRTGTGTGFFKGLWDAMGDEPDKRSESVLPLGKQIGAKAAAAVSAAVRIMVPPGVINVIENVREKIKAGTKSILKRLGKKEEAFTALTDPKEHFTGRRQGEGKSAGHKEKGTRTKAEAVYTVTGKDSHLMDSYSKTGAYCKLNENLTYQKKGVLEKPGAGTSKDE